MDRRRPRASLLVVLCLLTAWPTRAWSTQYPVTVTDMAGRQVTIPAEPKRIAVQDGRDVLIMALLDRDDPTGRIAVWNNILRQEDAASWELLARRWPQARAIPDMGFGDDGQVNVEQVVAARPDLMLAQRRALGSLQDAGVDRRLAELGIPLVLVDTFDAPVPGATRSVDLVGRVMNREAEAAEYVGYYDRHLQRIRDIAAAQTLHPKVFVEVLAGRQGPEQCCFTHGDVGWGLLVQAVGAVNVGSLLLKKLTGDVTLETVIAQDPDVYVMTGRGKPGSAMVPLGYDASASAVASALGTLERRPGFDALGAAQDGRVFGLWHLFYNNPYNVVALEYLARFVYPQASADLDPVRTYEDIIARFTRIPAEPFIQAAPAPRVKE